MRLLNSDKKENPMKSTLIHLLSVVTLATSMTAFAAPKKNMTSTNSSAATTCTPASRDTQVGPDKGQPDNDQERSRQMKINEQEKQWLHDFQNMVAG
jgi:hypothetical protein